jgi:hypothetical protein
MTDLDALEAAAALVHRVVPPTPQYCWPLLSRRLGAELWVKHENHTPIGAFKIRGGLVYLDAIRRSQPEIRGVVTATTGNHGQSIALAATRLGLDATIVVPYGNSVEKNRAMAAFGARLVEAGHDFQAAYEHALELAEREKRHFVRSYHPLLVRGVASSSPCRRRRSAVRCGYSFPTRTTSPRGPALPPSPRHCRSAIASPASGSRWSNPEEISTAPSLPKCWRRRTRNEAAAQSLAISRAMTRR